MITLGSHFDGISAFPLAASKYGIVAKWATEIEKFPIQVSKAHFPEMKHYGSITDVSGYDLEPVDIISFGSPCQDLSVAGKRKGLDGERSGLFMEAVRTIREMREKTDGRYPRFAIWENVPGAFSSNGGHDFRAVLEELAEAKIPLPKTRWSVAGMVTGGGCEIAWRCLDAQYWGVPQRRKRIFLVTDFRGERAGEILFESQSVSGDTAESREARQETTSSIRDCPATASRITCDMGGVSGTVSSKWAKGTGGPAGDERYNLICVEPGAASRLGGHAWEEVSPTLRADMGDNQPVIVLENHPNDSRLKIDGSGTVQTLTGRMGTGGGVMCHV